MSRQQVRNQLERMGLEPTHLPEWDTISLLNLLEQEVPSRYKGRLKNKSRGLLESCSPRYILSIGFGVECLIQSTKVGYIGIDVMSYPNENESWNYFFDKMEVALNLHRLGIYEKLGVYRRGIALTAPTPHDQIEPDNEKKNNQIFDLLEDIESSEFFNYGILDFREIKDRPLIYPPA